MAETHVFTEGEKKCLKEYWETCSKTPRKNLMRLVRHINMLNPAPTEKSWEYIFFDRQLDDTEVNALLKMKLRHPYYIKDLAKVLHSSVDKTARFADKMVHIGILEYTSDDHGVDMVQMPVFAPGAMENTSMEAWRTDKYPEMAPAFLNYILDLQKKLYPFLPMGSALMRAIPVEESIQDEPKKVKYEELSYWLDKAGESIAVAPCECRKLRRMVGEGTADLEGEWCINLGKYAESCIRVGKARRISRAEAEDILKRAEELGYVHQLSNIDGPDFSLFICNCSWDTCMALKTSWYTSSPSWSRSNYVAEVHKENCVACGGCVEVCPQNAVKLGQKLCQSNPVEIKNQPIPDNNLFFGKDNWKTDLLTNRDNVVPETGTSPCKTNCPAHISVQGYLRKAAEGKYDEALAIIKKENPFPAVCGRVCARFCEQVCTRGDQDQPVAIDEVKKFIAQQELFADKRYIPKKRYTEGKKIAVIGGGPAGLSCAYYLAVYGHSVTVFEKEEKAGGMMMYGMPSFRLERDVVGAEIDVIRQLGVEIKTGIEVGKDVTIEELRSEGYAGFYIAIGAQGGRKLGIVGEASDGVKSGIDFLREVAKDPSITVPKRIVVVGGGNVAVDVARTAVRCGGNEISMFCLESREEMPAAQDEVAEAEEENIVVNCGWGPKEILCEDGKVTGIILKKCLSVKDSDGRFHPTYDEENTKTVACDMVLSAIGQSIEWNGLLDKTAVQLNRNNTAQADAWTYQTAEPDIFVGGDVYTGPRFAIDAIAAGKEGAESLHRYVWEGHSLTLGRVKRDNYHYIDKDNLAPMDYDHAKRQVSGKDAAKIKTFSDERQVFTEEQVKAETARCLGCGAARVDQNICIGCGLCTTRCKFDAIHLNRKYDAWGVPYEKLVGHIAKQEVLKIGRSISGKEV
jgi:NADPH-dependent glutamate synthase beta subunit-like oxidoreductase/NAD-dependent dihydropyrimidine dehydrogenase PreA subunit